MINSKRGEVLWSFAGENHRLCLTFGALAELEHHFETAGMAALSERLSRGALSAEDVVALLVAGLRGGHEKLTRQDILHMPLADALPSALPAIAAMLEAAFGASTTEAAGEPSPFPGRR